jgi:glycine betaine/choline ABC-type transport system substrate-binding protein
MRPTAFRRLLLSVLAVLTVACGAPAPGPAMVVGTSADPQIALLANVYAAGLRYYGTDARVQSFDDPLAALDAGEVSVVPGFTGRLLTRFAPGSAARSASQVYRAMVGALPEGIAAGDYAVAAEDKAAFAVTEATARQWGGRDLTALVRNCAGLSVGTVTGSPVATPVGGCSLPVPREFGSTAAMFDALRAGVITAASTSTADPGVPGGVVVLVDRKPALIPAQNVVALYRRNEMTTMQLRAINELAGVLDTAALTGMLRQVRAGADPRAVAESWLAENPLGR